MADFSMNEIETLAKRATRGAGYSWGLAEEAGQATRWLCTHGFLGCRILAGLLDKGQGGGSNISMKTPPTQPTHNGTICPLILGSGLLDRAYVLFDGGLITLPNVVQPEILFPFASWTALLLRSSVTVEWDGVQMTTNGTETSLSVHPDILITSHAKEVRIWHGGLVENALSPRWRATLDPAAVNVLQGIAARIYAPATEQSRMLGAGAGLNDND